MSRSKLRLCSAAAAAVTLLTAAAPTEPAAQNATPSVTPVEYQRPPEQTFLTLPEWFLVHSPAEYAAFIADQPPSEFPYFGHIGQFWQSYEAVYDATRDEYAFNLGYHVMVTVIGTSTTVEYGVKSAYETLIGRLSELSRTHGMTEEDIYGARVAQDYVDFIRVRPWYEYDFLGKLEELWSGTSLWGPDLLRKWERKYALTSEYGAKAIYGWMIGKATAMGYEAPSHVTAVVVNRLPQSARDQLPDLEVVRQFPDQSVLITVPRYAAFKHHAATLAANGVQMLEIAGNRTVILISVLAPAEWHPEESYYETMLTQPILTQPSTKRIVLAVPVRALARALEEFGTTPFQVEHVYDY